jgi:K+-transporting ATPase ATPase A chain
MDPYTINMLLFNACGIVVYGILRLQHFLPWNPADVPGMSSDLAFNVAVACDQHQLAVVRAETAISHFSPDGGSHLAEFVSAATGLPLAWRSSGD